MGKLGKKKRKKRRGQAQGEDGEEDAEKKDDEKPSIKLGQKYWKLLIKWPWCCAPTCTVTFACLVLLLSSSELTVCVPFTTLILAALSFSERGYRFKTQYIRGLYTCILYPLHKPYNCRMLQ